MVKHDTNDFKYFRQWAGGVAACFFFTKIIEMFV